MPAAVDNPNQVVVTGIGIVSPLGADRETTWRTLVAGRTATAWLPQLSGEEFAREEHAPWAGAPAALSGNGVNREEPAIRFALIAAREAMADAALTTRPPEPHRFGCVMGTSKGGLTSFGRAFRNHRDGIATVAAEDLWNASAPPAAAQAVSREMGCRGTCLCPVAACATGLVSIIRGSELIRGGDCDAVLAGSSDASLLPAVLASFRRMGVMASGFDRPDRAVRPFDDNRTGFLVGEGAAVLVLERAASAASRGVVPYAEYVGGGCRADLAGITQVDETGSSLAVLITDVLRRANVEPSRVDYACLHGTATRSNDRCETAAIKRAFGLHALRLSCSSLKGAMGHLLGAAGSVETACALLALRDNIVPPTANLTHPDPGCDLDFTPQHARPKELRTVLKTSLGFGGHLAAAVFRPS